MSPPITEEPSGETPKTHRVPKSAFTRETAKAASAKAAQKRREKAARQSDRKTTVSVPLDLEAVITGLRDKAKTGNAQAASALLAYLTRFPIQQGSGEDWQDKALEDMTPDELAFAEAWALRQVNRAMRHHKGMQRAASEATGT